MLARNALGKSRDEIRKLVRLGDWTEVSGAGNRRGPRLWPQAEIVSRQRNGHDPIEPGLAGDDERRYAKLSDLGFETLSIQQLDAPGHEAGRKPVSHDRTDVSNGKWNRGSEAVLR